MLKESDFKKMPERNVEEAQRIKLIFDRELEKVRDDLEKIKIKSIRKKINQSE